MSDETKMIVEKIDSLSAIMTEVQDSLNARMIEVQDSLSAKLTEVQLTLENEINKKLSIIAEGQLDLTRKLDDALKIKNEKEMLMLRIISLENDVKRLKNQIEHIE